jgi:hypothetical protein
MKLKNTSKPLLLSFMALIFALTMYPGKAQAQLSADIEANISFPFYAGSTKLPPGKYFIHPLDNSDLTVMEISSADGSTSALFEVRASEANAAAGKGELIFNKYGNRYFLAKLFDEDNADGGQVIESRYEKTVNKATLEAQEHVPASRRKHQGS